MPGTLYPGRITPDYRKKELACEPPSRLPSPAVCEDLLGAPLEVTGCPHSSNLCHKTSMTGKQSLWTPNHIGVSVDSFTLYLRGKSLKFHYSFL